MAPPRKPALLGCEEPRIFTPPLRPLTPKTSKGFEVIDFATDVLGINLHPWQRWALIHGLELLTDGTFRFRTLLVLVARQNGKTTLMLVIALWRMYVDRAPLVIGTAQSLDIAEEAWQAAVDMAEGVPELAEEIEHIDRTNGKKALRLETGERYKVAAASRRGGRSLSGDLVLLDELREHRNWESWGAVSKTTMARAFAQILGFSNAGDKGSVVLSELRRKAMAMLARLLGRNVDEVKPLAADGFEDDSLGIFEWSATPSCPLDDRPGWAQANPSLGHPGGITERAIISALGTDPEPVFRTEVLCQWVDSLRQDVYDGRWADCEDELSEITGKVHFAISVSNERDHAAIDVAGLRSDGLTHVELVHHDEGTAWIVGILKTLRSKWGVRKVMLHSASGAASLTTDLMTAGFEVDTITTSQYAQACGWMIDAVTADEPTIRHIGQPELNDAVAATAKRMVGDATVWDRKDEDGTDITPHDAATIAAWGVSRPALGGWAVGL